MALTANKLTRAKVATEVIYLLENKKNIFFFSSIASLIVQRIDDKSKFSGLIDYYSFTSENIRKSI